MHLRTLVFAGTTLGALGCGGLIVSDLPAGAGRAAEDSEDREPPRGAGSGTTVDATDAAAVLPLFGDPVSSDLDPELMDCVGTADFNGDGKTDLFMCHSMGVGGMGAFVALSAGAGIFGHAIQVSPLRASTMAAVDLDADGRDDLLIDDQVVVKAYRSRGDGTFDPPLATSLPPNAARLAFADMNGDGRPDAVIDGSAVALLQADGTFGPITNYPAAAASASLISVGLADYDGDGHVDSLTCDETGALALSLGNAAGDLATSTEVFKNPTISETIVGDVTRDQRADVILNVGGGPTPLGLQRLVAKAGGGFLTEAPFYSVPAGELIGGLGIGDFDRDGTRDLVALHVKVGGMTNPTRVSWFRGGPSAFGAPVIFPLDLVGAATYRELRVGDFDGDGKPDVAVVGGRVSTGGLGAIVTVLRNQH